MSSFREKNIFSRGTVGVGVDIIDACNTRCRQCFYEKGKNYTKLISFERIAKIIEKIQGIFSEFYILGGEPTLHPQLAEILKLATKKMKLVVLVTNGQKLADEEYCKKIAVPGVHIHMHRRATNPQAEKLVDSLYQQQGAFRLSEKAWNNLERYWRGSVSVQVNLLRPLVQEGHIMDIFKWAREKGYQPAMELVKSGPTFERGNDLDVAPTEIEHLYGKMHAYDQRYFPELAAKFITPPYYGKNCTLIETGVHVTVDGNVVPCVSHCDFPIGNIFTDDLDTILKSELCQAIRDSRTWIVGPCVECQYFDFCKGGCRGEALWSTGCPRASNFYCWHIPKEMTLGDMAPMPCENCILEKHSGCGKKV